MNNNSKEYGVNRNSFKDTFSSAKGYHNYSSQIELLNKKEGEHAKCREQRDSENHDNLESIAQNTGESVEYLKELNEALKKSNELLEEKNESLQVELSNVLELLHSIFDVEQDRVEENREFMRQATELACDIDMSLKKGERINWKDKAVDTGIQVIFQAFEILLKMNGI